MEFFNVGINLWLRQFLKQFNYKYSLKIFKLKVLNIKPCEHLIRQAKMKMLTLRAGIYL